MRLNIFSVSTMCEICTRAHGVQSRNGLLRRAKFKNNLFCVGVYGIIKAFMIGFFGTHTQTHLNLRDICRLQNAEERPILVKK